MKRPFFKKEIQDLIPSTTREAVVKAIKEAEQKTSGEIRVFAESRCRYLKAIDRAAELFYRLRMEATENRNAVLVYLALKDRQSALFGDSGVFEKTGGANFWEQELKQMNQHFKNSNFESGLVTAIENIGTQMAQFYPFNAATHKNELPDEFVFGK